LAHRALLVVAATWLAACEAPIVPYVVTGVHRGPGGLLFVERCALRSLPHPFRRGYEPELTDCETDIEAGARLASSSSAGRVGPAPGAPITPVTPFTPARATPPAPPPSPGALGIIAFPPGATIEVDGRHEGPSPLVRRALAAGRHHVVASWPDGAQASIDQDVEPGRSTTARLFAR
jgi:hypothetical protein